MDCWILLIQKCHFNDATTLLSALRTANNLWRIEDQNANAKEIARLAGRIYEKLALSLEDLVTIGKNLDKSKQDYESVRTFNNRQRKSCELQKS